MNFGFNRFVFNQLLGNNKLNIGLVFNNPRINLYNYGQAFNRTSTNNWLKLFKKTIVEFIGNKWNQ